MVIQCPFSHKVWKSAYNYTEHQACYIKLMSPIYLTMFFFTVTATSLPLQSRLHRFIFCLYRYKIAYYLSNTGKDKQRFILMSLKVLIYNMLLGYCTLMLGIVSYMHTQHLNSQNHNYFFSKCLHRYCSNFLKMAQISNVTFPYLDKLFKI